MNDNDYQPLLLRTHTSLWQVERKMYKFLDWNLPRPVSLRAIGLTLVGFAVWIPIMIMLPIPSSPTLIVFWVAPPVAFVYYANKPVAEGKNFIELGWSLLNYHLFQPKTISGLRPSSEPDTIYVSANAYVNHDYPA